MAKTVAGGGIMGQSSSQAMKVSDSATRANVNSQLNALTKESSNHAVTQAVELPRRMLAKTKTDKSNPIANNNVFDFVGSNGIFQASPSVVKFAGFEVGKTHTLKVRMINNSPAP